MAKRKKGETNMHLAVADYINLQYPKVIFTSESSGIRVPMGLAVQLKRQRSEGKLPDLIVLEPRGGFHGLILELKKSPEDLYLKNGMTIKGDKHTRAQLRKLNELSMKGYKALFVCGFDEAKLFIDDYMKL